MERSDQAFGSFWFRLRAVISFIRVVKIITVFNGFQLSFEFVLLENAFDVGFVPGVVKFQDKNGGCDVAITFPDVVGGEFRREMSLYNAASVNVVVNSERLDTPLAVRRKPELNRVWHILRRALNLLQIAALNGQYRKN